ncbi:MAG: hypothetical protein ACM3QX_00310, partial [Syntrophomonadaceae bacterium]
TCRRKMKDNAGYSNWNPSKGDYVKTTLIEQRNLKKKNRRMAALISGIFAGIILLVITLAALHNAIFG